MVYEGFLGISFGREAQAVTERVRMNMQIYRNILSDITIADYLSGINKIRTLSALQGSGRWHPWDGRDRKKGISIFPAFGYYYKKRVMQGYRIACGGGMLSINPLPTAGI